MEQTFVIGEREVRCRFVVSPRARYLRLTVKPESLVTVTVPRHASLAHAERFLFEKSAWVIRQLERLAQLPPVTAAPRSYPHFVRHKAAARRLVVSLIAELQPYYDVEVTHLSIRNQKTRWGSCSRQGRLSFSYRIVFLPLAAARYVVAHELSHLKEFNHSPRFWAWVAKAVPQYHRHRAELKKWPLR